MKQVFILLIGCFILLPATAQKAYLADPENFDPTTETKIMVDITQMDCQRLLGSTDPLYFWTWMPNELPSDDPNANGDWTNSNPALAMTNEGPDLWSFTMIPTEFYQVSAEKVYENDFSFLVKAVDGTGDGGGGCDEDKTEDLMISVDPPPAEVTKIAGFPSVINQDDFVTVIYDNTIEEKASMQNLAAGDVYVFVEALVDSVNTIQKTAFFQVGSDPDLEMDTDGSGQFWLTFVPEDFLPINPGEVINSLTFVIRRKVFTSGADRVDEELDFVVGCVQ